MKYIRKIIGALLLVSILPTFFGLLNMAIKESFFFGFLFVLSVEGIAVALFIIFVVGVRLLEI